MKYMINAALFGAALALAGCATAASGIDAVPMEDANAVPATTPIVETTYGKVQGLKDDGIDAFLGVRYGKAPTGKLRFKAPQKPDPWDGIMDATDLGAPAMQMYSPSGPNTSDFTRQMQTIFPTGAEAKIDNEDSLFLNVWTPAADGQKRPVMVWFHGGGYAYGSGGWSAYDGRNLAEKGDVVVVTVNHRLNLFGYMYLGDRFGSAYADSGNVGNLDLVASLEWVRDNIEAFGGDPSNVTIMGESGGGSKVSHMLATPAADGLFHKAIIQSGPGVTSGKKADAAKATNLLLAEAGITTLEQLQAIPAEDLLAAARSAAAKGAGSGMRNALNFGPIVDGKVLMRDPFLPAAPEQSKDVPVMIGWNKDEMTIFTAAQPWFGQLDEAGMMKMAETVDPATGKQLAEAYRAENPDYEPTHIMNRVMSARFVTGSYLLADQKARQDGAPVYMYRLIWETPVSDGMFRSPHTLDIPFMFNNAEESRVLVGPGDEPLKLEAMMSDAWLSFAKTGTPSSDLLPDWPEYDPQNRAVMQFDVTPHVTSDPEKAAREIIAAASAK